MKLSRALLERREITKKVSRIKEEIQAHLVTEEHEKVSELSILEKMNQLNDVMDELKQLNLKIDKANAQHLVEHLNSLRILDSKIDFYRTCRKSLLTGKEDRYYRTKDTKDVKNMPLESVNEILEKLENERKDLDSNIQEINWTTEI